MGYQTHFRLRTELDKIMQVRFIKIFNCFMNFQKLMMLYLILFVFNTPAVLSMKLVWGI